MKTRELQPTVRIGTEKLWEMIKGKRLGVIMNWTAVTSEGRYLVDTMHFEWKADIVRLFAMEHGLRGEYQAGVIVDDQTDPVTGLPVVSLFGHGKLKPDEAAFADLDAVVYCSLDIGIRYWTFTTTMAYCMKAARDAGKEFIVVDMPNPIGGEIVEGGLMESGCASFLCAYPLTLRHGMTIGELAAMFNRKYSVGCNLTVIPFEGWKRGMWYDETGLLWTSPGPNIPTLASVMGYATTGLLQSTNVSEGRGTTRPFELFGAPWLDGRNLCGKLNSIGLPGFFCIYRNFCPTFNKYEGEICSGVLLHITDPKAYRPFTTAVHILHIMITEYPEIFKYQTEKRFDERAGSMMLRESLDDGRTVESIMDEWNAQAKKFEEDRKSYLIYQ